MTDKSLYICMTADFPSPFDDNVKGNCCICGAAIIWRPTAPDWIDKVCIDCGMDLATKLEKEGEEIVVKNGNECPPSPPKEKLQ